MLLGNGLSSRFMKRQRYSNQQDLISPIFLEKTNEGRQLHYAIKRKAFTLQIDRNVQ
jgi:hypothetical protein